jgi:hypothetical protein
MFNEKTLRKDIVKQFGPAGAHIEIFDALERKLKSADDRIKMQEVLINKKPDIAIFKWLLGYTNFPDRKPGDPPYFWRSLLRAKLKAIGIEIK